MNNSQTSLAPLYTGNTADRPSGGHGVAGERGIALKVILRSTGQQIEHPNNYETRLGMFQQTNMDIEAHASLPHASLVRSHPDHKDIMGRPEWIRADDNRDRYLKPSDGRLALLKVQSTIVSPQDKVTWDREMIKDKTPWSIKLVYWCMKSVPELIKRQPIQPEGPDHIKRRFMSKEWRKEYFSKRWLILYGRWILTCFVLLVLLLSPRSLEGQIRNGGFYDPVRYRLWGYPKVARNECENKRLGVPTHRKKFEGSAFDGGRTSSNYRSQAPTRNAASSPEQPQTYERSAQIQSQESKDEWDQEFDGLPARHLRPRYLCFLRTRQGYDVKRVKDVIEKDGRNARLNYIFVSYTRVHFKTWGNEAKEDVCEIAEAAAREAGVEAFWLDFECTPGSHQAEDIHRICDIVRGCHSLVIALRPSPLGSDTALIEWGARIWTLPELLLCPSDRKIAIYTEGSQLGPEYLAKRNFAVRAWKDASAVRQLIDHYEGSLILTPLELVTIALQCMQERLDGMHHDPHYKQWAPGDMSYALMGLLRRRPQVNKQDSDFEAFARLSLANDTNLLLERLICMVPPERGMPWQKIVDAWGVRLWDIYPTCQIAGIGSNQTVVLDGVYGATIRWKSLAPVAIIKRNTGWRTVMKLGLRFAPGWIPIGPITIASLAADNYSGVAYNYTGAADNYSGVAYNYSGVAYNYSGAADNYTGASISAGISPIAMFGITMFILAVAIIASSPYLLLTNYRGKFWGTQAWFFGIEGYIPIETIEQKLFGANLGRLKWSTNGSTLSQHREAKDTSSSLVGECEGILPNIPETQPHQTPPPQPPGSERLFTLVDTYAMTVTLFRAVRPPVAVMICGSEGGMQRAVLCSYDWRTQTFCRETVVRMKTIVVEKMLRVDRFRFSLSDGRGFRAEVEREAREGEMRGGGGGGGGGGAF